MIEDDHHNVFMSANSTVNDYYYTLVDHNECQLYQTKVAAFNGVGRGMYSQPVTFTFDCKLVI